MRAVRVAYRYLVAFLMLAYGFAKLNQSQFTVIQAPLDGVWAVERVDGQAEPDRLPVRIYFERNRARMVHFAHSASVTDFADSLERQHFAVDETTGTLEIREVWRSGMAEGDTVFAGGYQLRGDTLLLRGVLGPPGDSVRARLLRVEAPPGTGVW